MDWFLYDNSLRHERVKELFQGNNWFLHDNGLRHERVKYFVHDYSMATWLKVGKRSIANTEVYPKHPLRLDFEIS